MSYLYDGGNGFRFKVQSRDNSNVDSFPWPQSLYLRLLEQKLDHVRRGDWDGKKLWVGQVIKSSRLGLARGAEGRNVGLRAWVTTFSGRQSVYCAPGMEQAACSGLSQCGDLRLYEREHGQDVGSTLGPVTQRSVRTVGVSSSLLPPHAKPEKVRPRLLSVIDVLMSGGPRKAGDRCVCTGEAAASAVSPTSVHDTKASTSPQQLGLVWHAGKSAVVSSPGQGSCAEKH